MGKFEELGLVFALVNRSGKGITQLALSARKTKSLGCINEAFAAAEEVINRRCGDVACLCEIAYAYGALTTFVDCCCGCLEQSLASVVYFSHNDKRRSGQVFIGNYLLEVVGEKCK